MGVRVAWFAIIILGLCAGEASAQELAPILMGEPAPGGLLRLEQELLLEHFSKQEEAYFVALDEGKRRPKRPEQVFVVVDTPYEIWSGQGSYVRVVAYSDSFAPLPGAVVYLDQLPVGMTDARGSLVFRNVPREDGQGSGHTITVIKRRTDGPKGVNAKTVNMIWPTNPAAAPVVFGQVSFESYQRTESFESTQMYAYTDRGVYNPGQTLHLRALAWRLRGDFEAIEGQEVEVRLTDPQGRLVGGEVLKTDPYGIVRWDLALPSSAHEGVYTLTLQEGEDVAEARVRVERFVAPVIAMRHTLPRYVSWDKEGLEFEVRLSSFQGGALKGGGLVFEARAGEVVLCKQERANAGGELHTFALDAGCWGKLKAATGDGGRFEARLVATDGVGRSDTLKREILLTSQPYTVVLEKDKDEYAFGELAKLLVKVVDVDEAPVPNHAVRLEVLEYPSPDAPGNGDPRRRILKGVTNGFGVAQFDVKVKVEETCLDAYLKDVDQALASECLYAVPERPIVSKVQAPLVKERAKVPIEVQIKPGYVPVEAVLHGDIVDSSGALVQAFDLPIQSSGAGYVAKGSFEAPSWGTMLLTMFVAAKHGPGKTARVRTGLLTEGQQITVEPDKALTIKLDGVPDEARPGQPLSVTARVLDAKGQPADASVQVSVVDEAVLSLLDPMEVSPMRRFYNPELKVLSTTGSEILTWPVVSRNWGDAQQDIALPPFGYQAGDWEEPEGDAYGYGYGVGSSKGASKGGAVLGDMEFGGGGGGKGVGFGSAEVKGKVSVNYPMTLMPSADPAPSKPADAKAPPKVEDKLERRDGGRERVAQAPKARLVLRTELPETALWLDRVTTQGGALRFEAQMPDSITQQRLTVFASDRKGGVGVTQKLVKVTQALVARSDLPPALLLGEEVEVRVAAHNLSPKAREVEVSLHGEGFEVVGAQTQRLKLAAGELLAAPFRVRATRLGASSYEARAKGGGLEDAERREVFVRAGGVEVLDEERGVAASGKPFASSFEVQAGDEAFLTLAVPGVGPAARLLEEVDGEAWGFVEAPGTRAASAWWALRLLQRQKLLTPERERRLRGAILEDMAWISAQQTPEGGYAYLRTGRASPWLTGRALEGLTAAREADLNVPDELLQGAAGFILSRLNADGLVDARDVAWWEGSAPERQLALSVDLFRVLAEAGPRAIPAAQQDAFGRLRGRAERALKESADPLTLGHAGLGLLAWEAHFPGAKAGLDGKALARKLLDARRRGHWEPSWFNAAGGRWECTAGALELLQRLDPASAASAQREAFLVLMAGRDLLGSWHNGAGTVMTLRALAALPPSVQRQDARLGVSLNGEPVAGALIEARDPFAGALPLARVELVGRLKPGRNVVEVSWGGEGEVVVQRVRKRAVAPQAAPQGWQRVVRASQAQLGGLIEVEQRLGPADGASQVLEERLPALVEPDAASLDKLRQEGTLDEWGWDEGRLRMVLSPSRKASSLVWRMEAVRPGVAVVPSALLWTPAKGEAPLGVGSPSELSVE